MKVVFSLFTSVLMVGVLVSSAGAEPDDGDVMASAILHEAEAVQLEYASAPLARVRLFDGDCDERKGGVGSKISIVDDCCSDSCCCCGPSLYASVNLAGSSAFQRAGGFNTVGIFQNFPDGNPDEILDVGGAFGVAVPRNFGTLRLEAQGMFHDVLRSTTGSFPGPPGPPTFLYRTRTTERWSLMGNAWYDIPLPRRPIDIYLGGGIGGGGADLSVNDTVVQGRRNYTNLVWQVGGGITYHRSDRLSIDFGYRYVDYGKADIPLASIVGAVPAGNYTSDLTAHQLMLSFRFNALQDFLPNR